MVYVTFNWVAILIMMHVLLVFSSTSVQLPTSGLTGFGGTGAGAETKILNQDEINVRR